MTDARRDDFLADRRYGMLTTLRDDGSPVSVPVWYHWDGRAVSMFAYATSHKVANLRGDPRANVLVTNFPDEIEAWVRFDGRVEIKPGGLGMAERVLDRYYPEGDNRRAAMEDWRKTPDDWLMLELTPGDIRTHSD